jgi:uncharacterized protein YktB (UPF0637 family)
MQQLHTQIKLPVTASEGSHRLRKAKQEVRQMIRDSYRTRDEEINDRINELEKTQDPDSKKTIRILKNIKKAEEKQRIFKKLTGLRKGSQRQGITRIEIPVQQDCDQ